MRSTIGNSAMKLVLYADAFYLMNEKHLFEKFVSLVFVCANILRRNVVKVMSICLDLKFVCTTLVYNFTNVDRKRTPSILF